MPHLPLTPHRSHDPQGPRDINYHHDVHHYRYRTPERIISPVSSESPTIQAARPTPSRPPRSLTILTDRYSTYIDANSSRDSLNDGTEKGAPSPLSTGQLSQNSIIYDESPSNKSAEAKAKTKTPRAFNESSSAREVVDALKAQQKEKNSRKSSSSSSSRQKQRRQKQQPKSNKFAAGKRSRFHPMSIALGILGGIGTVVEHIVQVTCGECLEEYEDDDSYYKRRRETDQLIDDIEKIDRMNSFDTFGTMNTAGTINTISTYTTTGTNDTGVSSIASAVTPGAVDDDGNLIPAKLIQEHMIRKHVADKLNESTSAEKAKLEFENLHNITISTHKDKKKRPRKKKKKKKRHRKAVGFEYPPISKMRAVPRVNSDEKKKLFFAEDELDNDSTDDYDSDSDHEEVKGSEDVTNDEGKSVIPSTHAAASNFSSAKSSSIGSALRQGKYQKENQNDKS